MFCQPLSAFAVLMFGSVPRARQRRGSRPGRNRNFAARHVRRPVNLRHVHAIREKVLAPRRQLARIQIAENMIRSRSSLIAFAPKSASMTGANVLQRGLRYSLRNAPVTVLSGPRQCGKTTLARQIASKN